MTLLWRAPKRKLAELHQFTTYDGVDYILDGRVQVALVNTAGNMGLPPVNYVTQRTYKQDGVTEQAFFLQPRTMQLMIAANGCTRTQYFQLRNTLIDLARPNRGGSPGYVTYTFVRSDGSKRSIRGRLTTPSFGMSSNEEWDEFSFTETLDLECFDPTFFDPSLVSATVSSATASELVFPIDFPIYFDEDSIFQQTIINYTGNWYSYPVITIHGAADTWMIRHQELNLTIQYTNPMATDESMTLTLGSSPTLIDSLGNDMFGGLSPVSELQEFRIQPTPIVSGGTNTIRFYADNPDGNTNFTLSYYRRFVGI